MRADIGERRPGGFLHHIPHGPGDLETFCPGHFRRLDEQDVAAERCPGQARHHPGDGGARVNFLRLHEDGMPEQFLDHLGCNPGGLFFPFGDVRPDFAADRTDAALQIADTGFTRIQVDDGLEGIFGEGDFPGRRPFSRTWRGIR